MSKAQVTIVERIKSSISEILEDHQIDSHKILSTSLLEIHLFLEVEFSWGFDNCSLGDQLLDVGSRRGLKDKGQKWCQRPPN